MTGRAVGRILDLMVMPDALRDRGWKVDDYRHLEEQWPGRGWLGAAQGFASINTARQQAARDLPPGTAVSWMEPGGRVIGGFVVGHDEIPLTLGDRFPAFVLWRDHLADEVRSTAELARAFRDRMGWLVQRAVDGGMEADDVGAGRAEAEQVIDAIEHDRGFDTSCFGPRHHLACAARLQPRVLVWWDGFRTAWERADPRSIEERRHPVHPEHVGEFLACWQDGLRAGARARSA